MRLKEVCKGITDGSHNPPQGGGVSDYLMISSKNIFDDQITFDEPRYITEEQFVTENKRTNIQAGDILMTIVGTVGRAAVVGENVGNITLQRSVAVLHPKTDICDSRYLMYALQSKRAFFEREAHGVAQKGLYLKQLSDIEFDLPEHSKQISIVNLLDKANQIIKNRQKEIELLDGLIKARFVELFGDPNNSKGYPIVKVQDVADIQVGVVIKPAQYYTDAEHGVKAFRSLNIGELTIKDEDWVYFNEEGQRKNSKSILKENDLVIVRSGAPGTACVVTKQFEGSNAVDVIIAHPNTEKVNPYYLCAFTNYPHGKRQIEAGTGGAAQQHFNVGKYKEMDLIYPPKDEQDRFVSFVEQIDKSKAAVQKALDETQMLFNSLMQKYFG